MGTEPAELEICPDCTGGEQECPECQGTGTTYGEDEEGDEVEMMCDFCGGDGFVECDLCNGTGTVEAEED